MSAEKPISVGDLVQVVRPTKCCDRHVGVIFTVTEICQSTGGPWYCPGCGASGISQGLFPYARGYANGVAMRLLKRIPPLDELESEDKKEELTA